MNKLFTLLLLCSFAISSFSEEERDVLQKEAKEIGIEHVLVENFSDLGFPTYQSRDFWEGIPEEIKTQYIAKGEEYLEYDWPVVKATDYLEIIRSGDRRDRVYSACRTALMASIMAELVEGKGRFIDQIVNGVWYYSEQTWWGWSPHLPSPKGLPDIKRPSIDLGVGEIANILSWTWFLFKDEFDKIHPFISTRLHDEIMYKAVLPYYERSDFWWQALDGGTYVTNWNPWTNYNMLTSILICDQDWDRKVAGVNKYFKSLDKFINSYPDDGGCNEGPSYWGRAGASLYQNLDLLKRATNGKFDVFDQEIVINIGNYIYKAYINYPYFVNFSDADATIRSRPQIIYSYGKTIGDETMQKFGAFLAKKQGWGVEAPGGKVVEQIMQLMHLDEIAEANEENPLIREFWLPDTEVAGARDKEGSTEGFFFCAKGGHNKEAHNHNDLGTCVLYYDSKPCLVDIGRETYTAKTFGSGRYEIWNMQSGYHQLPKINGVDQKEGREFVATNSTFKADSKKAVFSTDISTAYTDEAKVRKWVRSYRLDRGKKFTVSDNYELSEVNGPTSLNFISSCKVTDNGNGTIDLKGDGFTLQMKYDSKKFDVKIEETEITDRGLSRYWDVITRIVMEYKNPTLKGKNQVIFTKVD